MITGLSFFKVYFSVKLHLFTSYDIVKYNGKTQNFEAKFNSRKDRYIFEKYAKKCSNTQDAIGFTVSNFMHNNQDWVYGDPESATLVYKEWLAFTSSLCYNLGRELDLLCDISNQKGLSLKSLLGKTESGNKAPLLQLYLAKKVSSDLIVFVNRKQEFLDSWKIEYENDPFILETVKKLSKYKTFSNPKFEVLNQKFTTLNAVMSPKNEA